MEKISGKDANGNLVTIGGTVLVPQPSENDKYKKEFVGHVSKFKDANLCVVVDQEDNTFDIEINRVESLP